jgi:hypothetical protein
MNAEPVVGSPTSSLPAAGSPRLQAAWGGRDTISRTEVGLEGKDEV